MFAVPAFPSGALAQQVDDGPAAATAGEPAAAAPVTAKIQRYAQRVIARHDKNGDGALDAEEQRSLRGEPARADFDGDGRITVDELARRVADFGWRSAIRLAPGVGNVADTDFGNAARMTEGATSVTQDPGPAADNAAAPPDQRYVLPQSRRATGAPDWFRARDRDGDGQLTLAEFSPKTLPAEVSEFTRLDTNADGVVTAREQAVAARGEPTGS